MNERIIGGDGIIIQKHPQMLKQLKKGSNKVKKKKKKETSQMFTVMFQTSAPKLAGNKSEFRQHWACCLNTFMGESETCLHQESLNILN